MNNAEANNIGKNIKRIRELYGIKQDTLARELAITQQAVTTMEKRSRVNEKSLGKVSKVLKVSPEAIKNFSEEALIFQIKNIGVFLNKLTCNFELNEHIGKKIEKLRIVAGLSQTKLGQLLGGISKQAISKIEKSEKVGSENLVRISKALGFTTEEVKSFTDEKLRFFIQNMHSNTLKKKNNLLPSINPIGKIVELYERILQTEQNKVQILQDKLKTTL